MYRLYLAGPITGQPDDNEPAFTAAAQALRAMGYEVFNPNDLSDLGHDRSLPRSVYLKRDLRALITCDALVLLPGFGISEGSRMEAHVAQALGMPIFAWRKEWRGCPRIEVVFLLEEDL